MCVLLSTIVTITINKKRKDCLTMTQIDHQQIVLHNILNGETVHQVSDDLTILLQLFLIYRSALSLLVVPVIPPLILLRTTS